MFAIASAVALAFVSSALAQPGPLTPLAADVGQPCVITWTPDPTGQWKQVRWRAVAIELKFSCHTSFVFIACYRRTSSSCLATTTIWSRLPVEFQYWLSTRPADRLPFLVTQLSPPSTRRLAPQLHSPGLALMLVQRTPGRRAVTDVLSHLLGHFIRSHLLLSVLARGRAQQPDLDDPLAGK